MIQKLLRAITRGGQKPRDELSEAKFAGIVAIASDAIISIDADQVIQNFNRGAEEIFGYTASEAIGQPLDTLLPVRFRATHHQHVRTFGEGSDSARRMGHRREISGLRKNGVEFPAEAAISKLDVGGQRIYTVVLRDITERKRYEQTQRFLADSGNALSGSLDVGRTIAAVTDLVIPRMADECTVYAEKFGIWPAPPEVASVFTTQKAQLRADGKQIIVPMIARAEVTGAIALAYTTTARTYDQEDLILAEEVGRRAGLAIDNARLYEAAQHAVNAREDVLAVVSHDLGNPLSAIRIGTTLLLSSVPEHERETGPWKHIAGIRNSTEQMEMLIKDLLEVTRIEAGQLSLERGRLGIAPLFAEAVELLTPIVQGKNLSITAHSDDDVPPIYADRERILQALSNLVGNAVKFTPEGGSIQLGARAVDDAVVLSVTDAGIGIAEEDVGHVFDRYWQAKSRRKGKQGLGLGLVIVKGIVEAHGGTISVKSQLGKGTTVEFTVPVWKNQIIDDADYTD